MKNEDCQAIAMGSQRESTNTNQLNVSQLKTTVQMPCKPHANAIFPCRGTCDLESVDLDLEDWWKDEK